jgi:hypothetical protein
MEDRTYNLFRSKTAPDLYCAVPQVRPLARFLRGDRWTYAGTFDESRSMPNGFRPEAAAWAAKASGFYLFQAIGPAAPRSSRTSSASVGAGLNHHRRPEGGTLGATSAE